MKAETLEILVLVTLHAFAKASNAELVQSEGGLNKFRQELFSQINKYREQHQAVKVLFDDELTREAQAMAEARALGNRTVQGGANYWQGSGFPNILSNGKRPVNSWYKQRENYKPGAKWDDGNSKAGSFTQLVWKNSKTVGIGQATGPDKTYVVAVFRPKGNLNFDTDAVNNVNPEPKESTTNSSKVNMGASTNQKLKTSSKLSSEQYPAHKKETSDMQNKKYSPFRTASIKQTSPSNQGIEKDLTKKGNEIEDLAKNLSETLVNVLKNFILINKEQPITKSPQDRVITNKLSDSLKRMTNLPIDQSADAIGKVPLMNEPTQNILSTQNTQPHDYSLRDDGFETTAIPEKTGALKITATSKTTTAPKTTALLKTTAALKATAPQKMTLGLKQDVVRMSNHKVIRQNFGRHVVHIFPYPAPKRKINRKKSGKDHQFHTSKLK